LDEIIASQEIAKAKKQLSRAILEQYKIKAPFDGQVGLRKISVGSYIKNGEELLILQDLTTLKFDFQVPEKYSNLVNIGQAVTIKTNAFSDLIFGVVNAIDVGNQNQGRVLNLRTLVDNQNKLLRSGMFGKVNLIIQKKEDAVVVLEEALFSEQSSKFVWKVNEGIVKKTPVVTGLRLNEEVEIVEGLKIGDTVVTAGHLKLRKDGQKVVIVKK
jgi:membrane fusion protein (multidrug efflux system)